MSPPDIQPEYASPTVVCRIYGIGRTTLFALLNSGKIESVKIGRARRIKLASVERYFDRLKQTRT
ncbi:helix-turn-helix domain-containing protein [Acetobacter sp. DsW_059]|uniref:helix-turn-helix domain-containing protein n=1 Tax=Acetobacter sp. DsW_059 TaxID=1670661 RepID=UPI000A36300F|nr:helix-turn-helix domain-containing protein [Acetobacter sp. DsW_059]